MPIARRTLLASAIAAPAAARAQGADWRQQYRELRLGISSAENERDAVTRHQPFAQYIERSLGVPLRIFRATDYAGVVEAMRNNHVEFARIGPANYALARRVIGERVAPIAKLIDNEGQTGYFSVVFVKADAPFSTIADLRGRSIAWADPNSTSGFAFPTYYLRRELGDIDRYFGRTGFSGSHEQSVIAVLNGTFDSAATFWSAERVGNVPRMEDKGMIPRGSVRNIWRSPQIPNSPVVLRTDLPDSLRADFTRALFAMPETDAEAWSAFSANQGRGLAPARHEDYLDVIAVTEENAARRRNRG
jgi:phosphonate transport system substrate-binding protein